MTFANQKGNVIAYVIIAMTTVAALAVGSLYMTSSSALGELGANNLNKAYFLALAGKEYALINNLGDTTVQYPGGRIFTFANGDKFKLMISWDTITSTGIVNEGTPFEAKRQISITKKGFGSRADISGFAGMTLRNQPGSLFAQVNAAGSTASLGGGEYSKFGALVYGGGATQGNCQDGKCDLGTGFRAFFVFRFAAGSTGDGFTFAFFNGDGVDVNGVKNDIYSVGGDNGRGELLGYSGDSRVDYAGTSFLDGKGGRGIQPPKVAIEFDTYSNQCGSCLPSDNSCLCSSCSVCGSGSRCDGLRNHMAYVFWGDNTNGSCVTTIGRNTYDDNKHGAGSGSSSDPQNARSGIDPSGLDTTSYFNGSSFGWPSDWLLSNTPTNIYAVRVEVTRSVAPNTLGNYDYTMNTWIKQCPANDITCPAYDDTSTFANAKISYNDVAPADVPTLSRTFVLSPTLHQNFNSFYFGWTAATGGATQNVTLNRFRINFLK